MESLDVLILAVEASIALAGFAGIIASFQFGAGQDVKRGDVVGLEMIVQFSLLVALASSIPIGLIVTGFKEETIWTVSSVVGAILILPGLYLNYKALSGVKTGAVFRYFVFFAYSVSGLFVVLYMMNALDIVFHRVPGPLIWAQIWFLSLAGFMFSRLLLRPIWRRVREQEATKLADAAVA